MAAHRTRRPRVLAGTPAEHGYSFPAEWQAHAGTWISWPRPEGISFPGFYHRSIRDVVRVVKAITAFEPVHLNVPNENYVRIVRETLREGGVPLARVVLHQIRTNECWTRDHGPAFVQRTRRGATETAIVDWGFNARVRAVSDLSELRTMRSEHTDALAGRQSPTLRLRTLDIIEAIDDRVTNLRANRGGPRSQ